MRRRLLLDVAAKKVAIIAFVGLSMFATEVQVADAQDFEAYGNLSDGEKIAFAEIVGRKIFDTYTVREMAKRQFDAYRADNDSLSVPNGTWVVTPYGTNSKAAIIDTDSDGQLHVRFQLQVDRTGELVEESIVASPEGADLDEFQLATYRAIETAHEVAYRSCTANRDVIAIEDQTPSSAGGYSVYLLAVPDERFVYQLGRHYRVQVDRTGQKMLGVSKISDSCFQIRPGDGFDVSRPERSTYLVRHSVKTAPDEVDVYLNLTMGLPLVIYTTTSFTTWNLDEGEIEVFGW